MLIILPAFRDTILLCIWGRVVQPNVAVSQPSFSKASFYLTMRQTPALQMWCVFFFMATDTLDGCSLQC